jgi:tRNA pseudouridine32 synthase/23S rRNA pseudouridine746 synthase
MTRRRQNHQAPLPARDGISANHIWLPVGDWPTMLSFLVFRFPAISETVWCGRMARGEVVDERGAVINPQSMYRAGARLFYYRELDAEQPIPFAEKIIYQDDHIVIADKPHFLPIAPSGRFLQHTLLARLKRTLAMDHLVPLHRLDRETAGLVMFSKNVQTRDLYHALFREHRITKTYTAVASFNRGRQYPFTYRSRLVNAAEFYRRQEVDGEPNSETHIDVIKQDDAMALYKLNPVSGKTHQLRVHMAALGMPILNDTYYPVLTNWKRDDFSKPLQLLARAIEFKDPISGIQQCFCSDRNLLFKD